MARERGLHAPEPDTNVSRPEKFSKRSCNSKGSAVISVETSRQKAEPSQREGRVEESKVLSGELVGEGTLHAYREMPSTEIGSVTGVEAATPLGYS